MAINTSVKTYAEERNRGMDDIAAHAVATQTYGTGGSGSGRTFSVFNPNVPGGSPGDTITYQLPDPKEKEKEIDITEYINQMKAAAKTEGPFEHPDLEDDSENDNEAIE